MVLILCFVVFDTLISAGNVMVFLIEIDRIRMQRFRESTNEGRKLMDFTILK